MRPGRAWSFSGLKNFEVCPKRFYHTAIKKDFVEEKGEVLIWGQQVHEAIEKHMKKGKAFPLGMKQLEEVVAPIKAAAETRGATLLTEQKLALNDEMKPCGWFDEQVWVRVVLDCAILFKDRAMLVDWKTGKRKEEEDQLALMAGVMFAQEPELETVDSAFVWLGERKNRRLSRITYTRDDVPAIWERFLKRVENYQDAFRNTEYPAQPGHLCRRYCPVKSCPYHGS